MESGQFGMQTDQNQMSSICFPTGKAHADNCSCTQAVSQLVKCQVLRQM